MENVPWLYVVKTQRYGEKGGVTLTLKNDANFILSIDSITLNVIGTYQSSKLEYRYFSIPKGEELGRIFETTIPYDTSYFEKECQLIIRYKNQYSKRMKSISPAFDIFSGTNNDEFMSIERKGKPSIMNRPFRNEIA